MKISELHLGFIGFGHIAQALFHAIDSAKLVPRSQILFTRKNPSKSRATQEAFHITGTALPHLLASSDLLFFCIPPQAAPAVLTEIHTHASACRANKVISLMAGISLSQLAQGLTPSTEIVRVMPNLALTYGESLTFWTANQATSAELESFVHLLFSSAGKTLRIPEPLMHFATALAGSGPALILYLMDAVVRFGIKEGLSPALSREAAAQVLQSAAALMLHHEPADLLQQIATPHGTTEAALQRLSSTPTALHLQEALQAATLRAAALS